jgi:uncharacterized RDD family membrane protein YckC
VNVDTRTADSAPVDVESAALSRRFLALFVDWILCLLIGTFIGKLMGSSQPWQATVVLIAEYTFFVGLFAQTPGMSLLRIRCVSITDGGRIGVPRAFLRGLLLALLIPALVLNKDQRGWHDRAAGSVVVKNP